MKPLLVPPFLTERDLQVWGLVCERFRPHSACLWYEATQAADRRDAELMFGYEGAKARYIASAGVFAYWEARRMGVDLARRAMR